MQCPTALEALGDRVSAQGPIIDIVAMPPWEVPNWRGQINHMGVTTPQDHKCWVDDLYGSISASGVVFVSVTSTVSNLGHYNNLMVGRAAAILNIGMGESCWTWTHYWALGTEVTQYDVDLHVIAMAAQWVADFYTDQDPPSHLYLLSPNWVALTVITKVRSLNNQQSVLHFHSALMALCSCHGSVGITLMWSLVKRDQVQDSMIQLKALSACRLMPCASLNQVQSAAYQKAMA